MTVYRLPQLDQLLPCLPAVRFGRPSMCIHQLIQQQVMLSGCISSFCCPLFLRATIVRGCTSCKIEHHTFCVSSLCMAWQPLYCSVDWAWGTNRLTSTKYRNSYFFFVGLAHRGIQHIKFKNRRCFEVANSRQFCCCPSWIFERNVLRLCLTCLYKCVQNSGHCFKIWR